jgi:hypothetical protein
MAGETPTIVLVHGAWADVSGDGRGVGSVDREPVADMHGGLGDHPRRCAAVGPSSGVHDQLTSRKPSWEPDPH